MPSVKLGLPATPRFLDAHGLTIAHPKRTIRSKWAIYHIGYLIPWLAHVMRSMSIREVKVKPIAPILT
jgi:hypothetical protein